MLGLRPLSLAAILLLISPRELGLVEGGVLAFPFEFALRLD